MAATQAVQREASVLDSANDAMLLLINGVLWETLVRQSTAEGTTPGQVLDKALRMYLEANGSKETVAYLHALAGRR
jgi:hypothetical protein